MIIIPDIHGRKFWKDAVKGNENELIIFLGDYLEPYTANEGITHDDAYENFVEILKFAKEHTNNVILLLGNHDFACIDNSMISCRHDYENAERNTKLFNDNMDLFSIAYICEIAGKKRLFTHAGIHKEWVENYLSDCLNNTDDVDEIMEYLNSTLHSNIKKLLKPLNIMSNFRTYLSMDTFGSCIWSDIREVVSEMDANTEEYNGVVQYVGHTQIKIPFINKGISCLDTHKAFLLDNNGELTEIK